MTNPIEIWGRTTSSNVQAVLWAIAELGLDFERHDVGGTFGKTDTDEYRQMNPMGLVPTLRDGDLVLFESNAIIRYLAAQYGADAFWPKNAGRRAELDVWAEWSKTSVYSALIKTVFWQLIRTPAAERNVAALDAGIVEVTGLMTIFEQHLGDQKYLGGAELSFADISFGHLLFRYFTLELDRKELPYLRGYYDRLCARSAYAKHVMIDYSGLKVL